jgi:hypothetical protein
MQLILSWTKVMEKSWMIVQEPIPHWNNFTVPELKEILEHCRALERLGIAQDEEMITAIERDIKMREKKISTLRVRFEPKHTKIKQQTENRINNKKQQPQSIILEQTT